MESYNEMVSKYGYNPKVDYSQVLKEFNSFVKDGRDKELKSLLALHGGIMAICIKYQYQQANK